MTISRHRAWSDFPVGTRVEVVAEAQDYSFFRRERGRVIENKGRYLGIIVEFDQPRVYRADRYGPERVLDPFIFNFNPDDLMVEGEVFEAVTMPDDKPLFRTQKYLP